MSEKKKFTRFVTPTGLAIYPHITTADTRFDKKGVYKTDLATDADDPKTAKLIEVIDSELKKALAETKKKHADKKWAKQIKLSQYKPYNTEDEEHPGKVVFRFKLAARVEPKEGEAWTQRPAVFDAKGNPLKVIPKIGGGTQMKVSFEIHPYFSPKDKEVGVTLRLKAVQIIELVEYVSGSAKSFGFDEEDGFASNDNDDESFAENDDEGAEYEGDTDGDGDSDEDAGDF